MAATEPPRLGKGGRHVARRNGYAGRCLVEPAAPLRGRCGRPVGGAALGPGELPFRRQRHALRKAVLPGSGQVSRPFAAALSRMVQCGSRRRRAFGVARARKQHFGKCRAGALRGSHRARERRSGKRRDRSRADRRPAGGVRHAGLRHARPPVVPVCLHAARIVRGPGPGRHRSAICEPGQPRSPPVRVERHVRRNRACRCRRHRPGQRAGRRLRHLRRLGVRRQHPGRHPFPARCGRDRRGDAAPGIRDRRRRIRRGSRNERGWCRSAGAMSRSFSAGRGNSWRSDPRQRQRIDFGELRARAPCPASISTGSSSLPARAASSRSTRSPNGTLPIEAAELKAASPTASRASRRPRRGGRTCACNSTASCPTRAAGWRCRAASAPPASRPRRRQRFFVGGSWASPYISPVPGGRTE